MTEQTDTQFAEAVDAHGGVWTNGSGCQLDAGVSAVKRQLEEMKAAQAAHQRFAIERLRKLEQSQLGLPVACPDNI